MKWVISTAIDSTKANSFLSRMHKSMGNSIINIEKERLYREGSSQEKWTGNQNGTLKIMTITDKNEDPPPVLFRLKLNKTMGQMKT